MNTKKSKLLNSMMTDLFNKDFYWVDDLLSNQSDYYTVSEKTSVEEAVQAGINLYKTSLQLDLPIVEVECYPGDFSVYFVNTPANVKKLLKSYLKKEKL